MDRKTITVTATVSIAHRNVTNWRANVRELRKILREEIGNRPDFKVLKIDTKEG